MDFNHIWKCPTLENIKDFKDLTTEYLRILAWEEYKKSQEIFIRYMKYLPKERQSVKKKRSKIE